MDEDRITEVLRAKRVGHEVPGMRTWEPLQAGHAGETWPRPRARTTAAKAAQSFDADEDELRGGAARTGTHPVRAAPPGVPQSLPMLGAEWPGRR